MKKKSLSALIALTICFSLLAASACAEGGRGHGRGMGGSQPAQQQSRPMESPADAQSGNPAQPGAQKSDTAQPAPGGRRGGGMGRGMNGGHQAVLDTLSELVEDGTVTQEVYDAVEKRLDEKAEAMKPQAAETPDNAADTPAASDSAAGADLDEATLFALLNAGVITQAQYDALTAVQAAEIAAPDAPDSTL